MQRTNKLRLEKPEAGDVYSSSTLTNNVNAIGKLMANYGGNVTPITVPITEAMAIRTDDWTLNSGELRIHGNGEVSVRIQVTSKKVLTVNDSGSISGDRTIADVFPEYETAIAQPLSSGNSGAAFGGYIAPNTTRIVLACAFGKYTSTIPIGSIVTLLGTYPLANVPKGIGLEQMPSKIFDTEVHDRNLIKIDGIANRRHMTDTYQSWGLSNYTEVFTASAGITITAFSYRRLIQGQTDVSMKYKKTGGVAGNFSGDIANFTVGAFMPGYYNPNYEACLTTSDIGVIFNAYITKAGNVWVGAMTGNSVTIAETTEMQLAGTMVRE